ncbi:hypothetical protein ACE6H2_012636 [Prunus campanulata]
MIIKIIFLVYFNPCNNELTELSFKLSKWEAFNFKWNYFSIATTPVLLVILQGITENFKV